MADEQAKLVEALVEKFTPLDPLRQGKVIGYAESQFTSFIGEREQETPQPAV